MPSRDDLGQGVTAQIEDSTLFRCGQLLLLMYVLGEKGSHGATLERIGYFDYFAANPYLLFDEDSPVRRRIRLAGWSARNLSYAPAGQRWATRRERLFHGIAILVSRGLVVRSLHEGRICYSASDQGSAIATSFRALYAEAFLVSADAVLDEFYRLADKRLAEVGQKLLNRPAFTIDLYDEGDAADLFEAGAAR